MDNQDHISRKIKEEFEKTNLKAPENLWSVINENLDNNGDWIDEQVRTSFENKAERAPKGIWEGIEKQLTIDKGWKKIYRYLQLQTFYKWTRRATILILFLLFGISFFNQIYYKDLSLRAKHKSALISKRKKQPKAVIKDEKLPRTERSFQRPKTAYKSNSSDTNLFEEVPVVKRGIRPVSASGNNDIQNTDQRVNDSNGFTIEPSEINRNGEHRPHDDSPAWAASDSALDNIVQHKDSMTYPISQIDSVFISSTLVAAVDSANNNQIPIGTKPSKFELGILTVINSTAIINNTTNSAFKETSLVSFVPSIGSNLGIQFVYNFNERHGLVSNLTYSTVNQAYKKFNEGSFNKEQLNFNFIDFQPLYQYSFGQVRSTKSSFNLKAGPFFGLITESKRTINGISEPLSLTNFDFGLTFQMGQRFEFNKLVLDYGINMDGGLINLNEGSDDLPPNADRTTHIGLGAYLSLRYKF